MPPACLGRRDGWTLMHRPAQKSQKGLDRMRMYPTRRTYSTPAPTRTEVHSASNSSRESPFEETKVVVTVTPRALPFSRIGAVLLLLTTATISALSEPLAQASITGMSAVPLVEPSTPSRSFLLVAPLAISVRLCINLSSLSPTKSSLPTALYEAARASLRSEPMPVTARTRPPEHLLTLSSSFVPAWYTLTPEIALASGRPVMAMPLGYDSG
mmetsp:Transcript_157/g.396  ORF Transcript_157/g.396 Transcript_157/m.396 type:complete len:213 (+) Transcript_157:2405-3043(+)